MHHQEDFPFDMDELDHGDEGRWRVSEIASFVLAGVTLGAAMALAGHHFGKNANARALDDGEWTRITTPATTVASPALPLVLNADLRTDDIDGPVTEIVEAPRVVRSGKSDFLTASVIDAAPLPTASADRPEIVKARLITSPPVWKLEKSWRMANAERERILTERKKRLARKLAARKRYLRERRCLATALYFEARSEGELGQMAVAKVILNRVKDPRFPNTICGVVYQGAEKRNACQFSFACDGKPDVARQRKAWAQARRIATKALNGKLGMEALAGVNYYHADYVRPRWAWAMHKVRKIGRHIFYRDG